MSKVGSKPAARPAAPKPAAARPAAAKPAGNKPAAGSTTTRGSHAQVTGTQKSDQVKVSGASGKVQVHADRFTADQKQLDAARTIGVNTKKGADRVSIDQVKGTGQSVKLRTGVGRDAVDISQSEGVKVQTGRGKDTLSDNESRGLTMRTGKGDDTANLTRTQDSTLRMGKGKDHATSTDVNNVKVRSAQNHVFTSKTAANRGNTEDSAAVKDARAKAEAKVGAQAQQGGGDISAKIDANGQLSVRGGKGDDNVTLRKAEGNIIVESGGKQIGTFAEQNVKSIDVRTGKGKDSVNLVGIDTAQTNVRTGRGRDDVTVVDSKNVNLRTGRGRDNVDLVKSENVNVRTGRGRDQLTDTGSKNLNVHAGRGKDRLSLTETLDSKVHGGKGIDRTKMTDVDNVHTRSTRAHIFTTPEELKAVNRMPPEQPPAEPRAAEAQPAAPETTSPETRAPETTVSAPERPAESAPSSPETPSRPEFEPRSGSGGRDLSLSLAIAQARALYAGPQEEEAVEDDCPPEAPEGVGDSSGETSLEATAIAGEVQAFQDPTSGISAVFGHVELAMASLVSDAPTTPAGPTRPTGDIV